MTEPATTPINESTLRTKRDVGDQLCQQCGYQLQGTQGIRCPECGFVIPCPIPADSGRFTDHLAHQLWRRFFFWLTIGAVGGGILAIIVLFLQVRIDPVLRIVLALVLLGPAVTAISWRVCKQAIRAMQPNIIIALGLAAMLACIACLFAGARYAL